MENVFKPFPIFSKAVVKEVEALELMTKYDNMLLSSINNRDANKSTPYCVYIKYESDLHWFINLFGSDRNRKHEMIKTFYTFDSNLDAIANDKELYTDDEFYCVSLTNGDTNIERYNNHSCNGNIVQLNTDVINKYNLKLKSNVLDKVYIINNGTPEYSMSGIKIIVYQCELISKENLKNRQLVQINLKEKFIV